MIRYFKQKTVFLVGMAIVFSTAMAAKAQEPAKRDFRQIDARIRIYPKDRAIIPEQLVSELVAGLSDSTEQVRAIYTWIAKNITYDLESFRSADKRNQSTDEVLKIRKAVCSGYSDLFKRLCEVAGIKAVVIEGYAKGYGYVPYTKFLSTNHAWNAVFLDNEWHFVDVTWAAGPPKEITGHNPETDLDGYFFIAPEKLIKTHLPEDPIWQLQDIKISLTDFETGITEPNKLLDIATSEPEANNLNEFDLDILGYKRSLNFNPRNEGLRARLSFAYVYKAISITEEIWKFSYSALGDTIPGLSRVFTAYLDSAQQTMVLAFTEKNRTIIDDEVNYQKGVFRYELAANLFVKAQKKRGIQPSDRAKIDTLFHEAEKHFQSVPSTSIYHPDAQKYLGNLADYRDKK